MTSNARGERFRRRVEEHYQDLNPADREYLEEAVYTMQLLDRLRQEYAEGSLVEQRQGGPRVRPVVVEARLQARALADLLKHFPDVEAA